MDKNMAIHFGTYTPGMFAKHRTDNVNLLKMFWVQSLSNNYHSDEPVHEISNNLVRATSKGSNQPAHIPSLIRAFTIRLSILRLLSY